jgi:D-tyrosyl-tRNA(Tyr) deacylase
MRFVIQRVENASVEVDEKMVAKINQGFLVLIGIEQNDNEQIADVLIKKLVNLRIFSDENDKMNLSLKDIDGELLLVSQFTLYANCKKGNRPSFDRAERFDIANKLYEYIIKECKNTGIHVETGVFGAEMKLNLINDGPVTIVLDSDDIL